MNKRQKQAIEAYRRARDFLDAHPLEAPATYGPAKGVLDDVVASLTTHTADQTTHTRHSRAETRKQEALKRMLREAHLRPISQTARAVLRQAPGIEAALRVPDRQLPVTRFVAEARGVRNAIAAYEPVFVANGFAADFLEQLDAAIAALDASQFVRADNVGKQVGAGVGIAQELQRGREAVLLLDVAVQRAFAGNNPVLAHWASAKRVQAVAGAPRGGTADPRGTDNDVAPPAAA